MLGEPGQGLRIALSILDSGRVAVAAHAIGVGRAAFEAAMDYAHECEVFGRKIFDHQAVAFHLAKCPCRSKWHAPCSIRRHVSKRRKSATFAKPRLRNCSRRTWRKHYVPLPFKFTAVPDSSPTTGSKNTTATPACSKFAMARTRCGRSSSPASLALEIQRIFDCHPRCARSEPEMIMNILTAAVKP